MEVEEEVLDDFLAQHSAKSLVKEPTCFKSLDNPSCIDLLLTNSPQSFQNTTAVATGLSDFHKMSITVLKTAFQKAEPKILHYRDRRNFNVHTFRGDLKAELDDISNYSDFEEKFIKVLDKHAPVKKKVVRANDKPFMTKALRRAIMVRSSLRNKFLKYKTPDLDRAFKKQRNYTNKLLKKEKKRYLSNLDMKNITDNKKFWQTVKPFFGNSSSGNRKITLVENEEIISGDKKVANTFSDFFDKAVSSLDLAENNYILNKVDDETDPVEKALHKFKDHPSIIEIRNQVVNDVNFSFSSVTDKEMMKEIEVLNTKKAGTFMNIPTKKLKDAKEEIVKPLTQIWNNEILMKIKFP